MSWLNLNQSLSSLKGQITNFATEVLSEGSAQDTEAESSRTESSVKELEEKCRNQELEIAALKKLNDELQTTLQSERVSRKNGLKEEESSWYWDPPSQPSRSDHEIEQQYKLQIQALQSELSALKDRDITDHAVDNEEEINRLRQENKNLTCSLEDLDNQHQVAMERLLALKKELQKNFEVLKQEHQDLKSNNDEYAGQIKALLQKMSERDQEIESLKVAHPDYDTLLHKYQNLERIHSLLRENAEKFQEENQELHEEVFKLQEQVTKLEHDIEVANKHNEVTHMVPVDKYERLLKELNDLKHRRNSSQVHLDEINIDDNAKSVIETLKRDINDLKRKLAQRDSEHQETTENKLIKPDKIMQLYNRYVNFELPVDYVGEIPTGTENVIMQKLEGVFKTLNSFKKDVDALEHKLSEKKQTVNNLQAQVDDVTTENEYLTSDIQHLERELEEMKKNNDFLISEIAVLKNLSKLEPIIETHEDNLAKLETELADSNRMNKTFESEIKRIENELKDVQNEKKILQDSLNDMKNKYTTMLSELKMCKVQTQAVHELESNSSVTHNAKLQEAVDKIDNLQKRLHSANSKNEQLLIDIHIIENDKVLLTKQIEDLKQEKQTICGEYKELESTNKTLDSKIHDLENKLDDSIKNKQDLDVKLKDLENKLDQVTNRSREIEFENNSLKEMKESVISSVTDIDKISNEKMQIANELDKVLQENSTLKEKIASLTNDILSLQHQQQELTIETNLLRQKNLTDAHNTHELHETINKLKLKADQYDAIINELLALKEENKKLVEKKLQLEVELSSTDNKIIQLEEEFEKLLTELNEKDSIIDNLNVTVTKNNIELENLHQNVTDLENSVQIKSQEIERLVKTVDELTQKLNNTSLSSNQSHEELRKLLTEKEEINKQIYGLNDEINIKNTEISKMTCLLQELEKSYEESKSLIDNKDKEIKELNQSIVELRDKIKASENTTQPNDEYAKLLEEKQAIEKITTELQNVLNTKDKELLETQNRVVLLENTCKEFKTVIDNATLEKNELINLVNLKHNESIQYHNEIQRLNQVMIEQNNEFKRIIEEKDLLIKNNSESCANCETIRLSLKEKDEMIMALNQNVSEHERLKSELGNASESVKNLTKRCEDLDKSLTIQLETVKKLTAENAQLSEQEQNSTRELERLRHHLVELEENFTQELMSSEQKLTECQARLHQVEERAKQTSTVYTSNSIRANQEVETLRNQIKLLEKQREEVQAKLSEADDARSRSEAALTNLQVVLEQFQLDKERDIHNATEKIRNKMEDVKRQNEMLQHEIARLNGKLEESIAGLQAATRLGDQVETKTAQINDLKEQVRALQATITAAEERYYNAISNQQDKVDKNLVKNLVVNYVLTANRSDLNRTQILRILSTVLDFNQTECEKLGLVRSANSGDSLAAEFVKFLQNESRPRAALPDMMGLQGGRSTPASSRKSSTIGPNPVFEVSHKRNPSTSSSNLLFQNLDSMETSSQVSIESESRVIPLNTLDTGINQTRNNEGAILKHVLKDM
ncbi:thyroid receptor-interacting protein 11-like isoform X1 [Maniola jurtina]|uniref:thyroid receptor-interacting protein 11-like isoform X1 n=1 Tax=Maniola jurtina TaxID=191418 RepID=UPI001E68608C|nr:thyroid receptor-interacting protein 11-like isoform X1 [Maniola jurtina]